MTNEDIPPLGRLDARLLTVDQVAEALQISRWTVYRLIWANDLGSVQIGRCRRVPREALDTYLARLISEAA
ncbi:MAG: excisionase [Pseudonocardiales bacterium]|nr:helix-turn-helix domain-containing protein [Actinomycetota bacterium]PZS22134.1 MAG: excisionase [Pseudonocardiales bacterium]